jgi:hypothetical protein
MVGSPSVGTKYQQRKAELIELIREDMIGSIELEAEQVAISGRPFDIACYFCRGRISGSMHLLVENTLVAGKHELVRRYYIHDSCYHAARQDAE